MTIDFKPSQVELSFPPLTDCFNHTESEIGAALILRALQKRGDNWEPILWTECQEVWRAEVDNPESIVNQIFRNPFARPDVYKLVEEGFMTAPLDADGKTSGPFEFTQIGVERLRKWVRA